MVNIIGRQTIIDLRIMRGIAKTIGRKNILKLSTKCDDRKIMEI